MTEHLKSRVEAAVRSVLELLEAIAAAGSSRPPPVGRPVPVRGTAGARSRVPRRGFAMLLVLIGIAVAAILAGSFLASRDNSLIISRNIEATFEARRGAMTALDLGVAMLQTETDWRSSPDGVLVDNYALTNPDTAHVAAQLTVSAWDIETDALPGAATEYAQVTATARTDADGDGTPEAEQEVRMLAYVPSVTGPRAAVDLAEFAVFAEGDIGLADRGVVARWPTAPLATLGRRVALASRQTQSATLTLGLDAACVDCTLYHSDLGGADIVQNSSTIDVRRQAQSFEIPFPAPPLPQVVDPDPMDPNPDLDLSDGSVTVLDSFSRFNDVALDLGGELTVTGPATVVADNNLTLAGGSRVLVEGDVTIVVFNDVSLTGASAIELAPGATLRLFVGQTLLVQDSYVGDDRPDDVRDHTGYAAHMDPGRVRIFRIEHLAAPGRAWTLQGNAVVKGSLYGPTAEFTATSTSALYGRIAAATVSVGGDSGIFYDHALDERAGYPDDGSALYDPDTGVVSAAVLGLGSLDPPDLQALADTIAASVQAGGAVYEPALAGGGSDDGLGPTPRPVPVEPTLLSIGPDMGQWEDQAGAPSDVVVAGITD